MSEAALALLEATGDASYLTKAEDWTRTAVRHYWDDEEGGFFFSADDTTDLIVRTKTAQDNATPSGNGVFLGALAHLYALTGKEEYRKRAESLFEAFAGSIPKQALGLATLLANSDLLENALQIVIMGDPGADDTQALKQEVYRHCLPNRVLQLLPSDGGLPEGHPASGKTAIEGKATAYVCKGQSCSLPVTEVSALGDLLTGK